MRVFEKDGKVNFVDDNNVFVGYDARQHCCEDAGYVITEHEVLTGIQSISGIEDKDFPGYNFDTTYIKDVYEDSLQSGGAVIFKCVDGKGGSIYVTIFNAHNGYYSHGFAMKKDEECIHEGYL